MTPGTDNQITLHILHTNDFHNHLTDELAGTLREAIRGLNGAPYLLLDAGDAIKAGNVDFNPFGEPILDRMSELGYHAMTLGNREFHVLTYGLTTKINRARFPVLSANIRPKKEGGTLPVLPQAQFEVGGLKVAVFGLTVPMVTERSKAAPLSDFLFDDPIATARRMVTELRYGADLLVALTHIGLPKDRLLAEAVPGIDLIIGGHSHNILPEPLLVNGTPIVQTGSHARYFGHLRLTVSRAEKPEVIGKLFPLKESAAPADNRAGEN